MTQISILTVCSETTTNGSCLFSSGGIKTRSENPTHWDWKVMNWRVDKRKFSFVRVWLFIYFFYSGRKVDWKARSLGVFLFFWTGRCVEITVALSLDITIVA